MKTSLRFGALTCAFFSSFTWRAVALCVGGSFLLLPSAFPQGSLTPPGAPAPTMKTLTQIDTHIASAGEKRIDVLTLAGDTNNQFIIDNPGSYYLSANLNGVSGKHGVSIRANGVTVDLNGFSIIGPAGSLNAGISVPNAQGSLAVRNGTVRNYGSGIDAGLANNSQFDHLRLNNDNFVGLAIGDRSLVTDCVVNEGATGVHVTSGADGCIVRDCVVDSNSGYGINDEGIGSLITNCIVRNNLWGIRGAGTRVTIVGCNAIGNDEVGIYLGAGGAYLLNNNCSATTNGDGISAPANGNRIEGNLVRGNSGTGVSVNGASNLIVRNSAGNNGLNYNISAGNRYGPIIDDTATDPTSAPSMSGNSAGGDINTTNPWANITY